MLYEELEKILGIYWECSSDMFKFHLKFHNVNAAVIAGERVPTKREMRSIVIFAFDPLGFISVFTVGGKLILREVWRHKVPDEKVPEILANSWQQWRRQMDKIVDFQIPRCYFPSGAV